MCVLSGVLSVRNGTLVGALTVLKRVPLRVGLTCAHYKLFSPYFTLVFVQPRARVRARDATHDACTVDHTGMQYVAEHRISLVHAPNRHTSTRGGQPETTPRIRAARTCVARWRMSDPQIIWACLCMYLGLWASHGARKHAIVISNAWAS